VSAIRILRRAFEPNGEKRSGLRELHKRELQDYCLYKFQGNRTGVQMAGARSTQIIDNF
jgi:hypothetical protein